MIIATRSAKKVEGLEFSEPVELDLNGFDTDWFKDENIIRMAKEIDDVDISIINNIISIQSEWLGTTISPEQLSGGLKTLIFLEKSDYLDNRYIWTSLFGPNCIKDLCRIANHKDIHLLVDSHLWVDNDPRADIDKVEMSKVDIYNEDTGERYAVYRELIDNMMLDLMYYSVLEECGEEG